MMIGAVAGEGGFQRSAHGDHALKLSSRQLDASESRSCPRPGHQHHQPDLNEMLYTPTIHTPKSAASKHMARSRITPGITQLSYKARAPETPTAAASGKTTSRHCLGYLLKLQSRPTPAFIRRDTLVGHLHPRRSVCAG